MKRYKRLLGWLLAVFLFVLPLTGCGTSNTKEPGSGATQQSGSEQSAPEFHMENYSLRVAKDYAEIGTLMTNISNGSAYSSAENVGIVDEFFAKDSLPSYAGNYGEQSSNTQILPEGVSKADTAVVADGYLYRVQGSELSILQTAGADTKVISTTTVCADDASYDNYEETVQAVAVQNNVAAVVTYVYAWSTQEADNGEWTSKTISQTHVKLYDLSDKAAPKQQLDYAQDGGYISAWLVNGSLYVMSDYYVMNLNAEDTGTFIPTCGKSGSMAALPVEKIMVNDQADTAEYAVISGVSLDSATVVDTIAATGSFRPYFASADAMYLCGWCYAMQESEPYEENQYQVTDYYSHAITLIADFSLQNGFTLEKNACINGRLSDMDMMDQQGESLRLGTLTESYTNRLFQDASMGFKNLETGEHSFSNEVHVLDKDLKQIGALTELNNHALMYYERFIGNLGYVIAYDSENPVYTLDLSDPTKPAVGEKLSVDDPAEILLRYGSKVLGLTAGGQLQLFDTENTKLPVLAQTGIGDTYTSVRYHLSSVLVSEPNGLVVLPADNALQVYTVTDDAIQASHTIDVPLSDHTRVLLADNLLYITTDSGVSVVDWKSGQTVAQVDMAVG